MAKSKTVYVCQNCGADSPKWIGKCPSCGEWNSYVEEIISKDSGPKIILGGLELTKQKPVRLDEVECTEESRIDTSSNELNRVLGGGVVPGSLVLIGGDPGIGKSTLLLQVSTQLASRGRVLYVSGEESAQQIKLRAERLGDIDFRGEISGYFTQNVPPKPQQLSASAMGTSSASVWAAMSARGSSWMAISRRAEQES